MADKVVKKTRKAPQNLVNNADAEMGALEEKMRSYGWILTIGALVLALVIRLKFG